MTSREHRVEYTPTNEAAVNREQFEASVLDLWVTTRIPLSRAHLQYHTGLTRQRLNRWLDELTGEGVLECDIDDDGEMLWKIPGAARSTSGPRSFAELGKAGPKGGGGGGAAPRAREPSPRRTPERDDPDEAMASIGRAALTLARKGGVPARTKDDGDNRKSLAVSAGLSFLGPLGWLYAGSLREAAVGTAIAFLVWKLIPAFLLMPILWLVMPLSAVVGLVYAWQYNRNGERTPLFLDGKKDGKDD
jgi:hypothetical protein